MPPGPSSTSSSDRLRPGLLAALAVALVLAVGQVVFALPPPLATEAGAMEPFARAVYDLDPRYVRGVSARSRVVRNVQGLRGSVLRGRPEDVLVVGGSTVACTLLDERDHLGASLERLLGRPHRVAVAGRGGPPRRTVGSPRRGRPVA